MRNFLAGRKDKKPGKAIYFFAFLANIVDLINALRESSPCLNLHGKTIVIVSVSLLKTNICLVGFFSSKLVPPFKDLNLQLCIQ